MRPSIVTAAGLLLALTGPVRSQSVQYTVLANPPSLLYSRLAPFLQRRAGPLVVENQGVSYSFPSDPG